MSDDHPPQIAGSTDSSSEIRIEVRSDEDVREARANVESLAQSLGFPPADVASMASAISQLAHAVLENLGSAQLILTGVNHTQRRGIITIAQSRSPLDQYGSLYMRLRDVRPLVDELTISETNDHTAVVVKKWR